MLSPTDRKFPCITTLLKCGVEIYQVRRQKCPFSPT